MTVEVATRVATKNFFVHNFRSSLQVIINDKIQYDEILGWSLKPSSDFNFPEAVQPYKMKTIDLGLRSNGKGNTHTRLGGVLAVGSSFTAGSEVGDDDTWPAQLEGMLNFPVNNAGQGGFVADQIILNAERLLTELAPKTVIVDLIPDSIEGANFSSYGWPKPYFTVESGKLVQHNIPVPRPSRDGGASVKEIILHFSGYSFAVSTFIKKFFEDFWINGRTAAYSRIKNNSVEVTCALLARLKRKTDENSVRLLLYLQYPYGYVSAGMSRPIPVSLVHNCAVDQGIQVTDEFDYLAEVRGTEGIVGLTRLYMVTNGIVGHKSPSGNLQVARIIADALKKPPIIQREYAH